MHEADVSVPESAFRHGVICLQDIGGGRGGDHQHDIGAAHSRCRRSVVQAWRSVIDDDACIVRLARLHCAADEFKRFAARALRIPVMDKDGFSCLVSEKAQEQARRQRLHPDHGKKCR
jgi:hypothetical protein